jgi:hypothetical protein
LSQTATHFGVDGRSAFVRREIGTTLYAGVLFVVLGTPACATTLIVSLGLLSTPPQVGIIVASVLILVRSIRPCCGP